LSNGYNLSVFPWLLAYLVPSVDTLRRYFYTTHKASELTITLYYEGKCHGTPSRCATVICTACKYESFARLWLPVPPENKAFQVLHFCATKVSRVTLHFPCTCQTTILYLWRENKLIIYCIKPRTVFFHAFAYRLKLSNIHVISRALVTTGFVNRFIVHLRVVTTNNYYTIVDFHTTNHSTLKSSQSTFTSLYSVITLYNGYSSAVFSLDVSW
jgi:hypothetical protein